jgi:hypothetical protein
MVTNILGGKGIVINGGIPQKMSIYADHPSSRQPVTGDLRMNGSYTQVFNCGTWYNLPEFSATVEIDPRTLEILQWAERKMKEERELEKLAIEYPIIKSAHQQLATAQEQLAVVVALVKTPHAAN